MEWLLYLLKVSACMALFYALYHFFLQPLTFFSFNRFYLLSTLVISFLIPALQLEIERQVEVQQEIPMPSVGSLVEVGPLNMNASVAKDPVPVSTSGLSAYSWLEIVNAVYWLIAAVILTIFAYQMAQLLKHITHVNKRVGRLKIVYKPTGFTNCSFLNYVFVDQQGLTEEELTVILQHEAVHANKLHSLDKLFVNSCKVFLWFNPLIYLYAQALEQMHEYEADQEASTIIGSTSYANLLLAIAVRNNNPSLVHSFVKNPLKARIEMLFTNPSQHMKKLMYLLTLPVCVLLLWGFAVQVVYAETRQGISDTEIKLAAQSDNFIKIVKEEAAGPSGIEQVDVVVVNSPRGKVLKMALYKDYKIKFVVNGVVYSLYQALNFDKAFVNTLSENRGAGSGRDYKIKGVDESDRVFWFGKQPALSDEVLKTRIAVKKYEGKTVHGKIVAHTYSADGKKMDGFAIKQSSGKVLKAYVNPLFAEKVNRQLKIGDDVKINVYDASYSNDCNCEVIGSGTYVKNGKVIFDRDRFIVDDRKEGVKTDYRTLAAIEYIASDSVKYSPDRKVVDLYGKVKVALDSVILTADHIQINNHTNIVTAFKGQVTSPYKGFKMTAEIIYYYLKTKQMLTNPAIETTD